MIQGAEIVLTFTPSRSIICVAYHQRTGAAPLRSCSRSARLELAELVGLPRMDVADNLAGIGGKGNGDIGLAVDLSDRHFGFPGNAKHQAHDPGCLRSASARSP